MLGRCFEQHTETIVVVELLQLKKFQPSIVNCIHTFRKHANLHLKIIHLIFFWILWMEPVDSSLFTFPQFALFGFL